MLSESLRAVISQTLLKTKDGSGRVAAHEIMIATPVSYTHLRAHETVLDLVCRLLLEKKKQQDRDTTSCLSNTH